MRLPTLLVILFISAAASASPGPKSRVHGQTLPNGEPRAVTDGPREILPSPDSSHQPLCLLDLTSAEGIAQMRSLGWRGVFDQAGRPVPEFRAVIGQLFPELGGTSLIKYSPGLGARLRLEDKTSLEGAGVAALVFDSKPIALIKWEPHPTSGTPVYWSIPAGESVIRGLHGLRAALRTSLGRRATLG